jgi:hypothetical protein
MGTDYESVAQCSYFSGCLPVDELFGSQIISLLKSAAIKNRANKTTHRTSRNNLNHSQSLQTITEEPATLQLTIGLFDQEPKKPEVPDSIEYFSKNDSSYDSLL